MTLWHVQKLYTNDGYNYKAIPYDLFSVIQLSMKMKNGVMQTIKFLSNSRLSEKSAQILSYQKQLARK